MIVTPIGAGLTKNSAWLAASVGVLAVISVIGAWWVINDRAQSHVDQMTENSARLNQLLIRQDIGYRISALGRLAQRWNATGGTPRLVWEADAARYVADMPGFQAIEWADSSLYIRWVVPLAGNEVVKDLEISRRDEVRSAVILARDKEQIVFAGPFELLQGGLGVEAYVPVYREQQFDGVIVGVLRLNSWLTTVVGGVQSADQHVRILLQGREVYRNDPGGGAIGDSQMERSEFEDHGMTWTILIAPTSSFLSANVSDSSTVFLIVGLLFSVLLVIVVYLVLLGRIRSRQLHDSAVRIATFFENLPGMAYRCTAQSGRIMAFVSDGCEELSGFSRNDFEAQRICWDELIHQEDRDSVTRKIQKAASDATAYEIEYRVVTRANQEKWVWERGRAVQLAGSEDVWLEGFISDISRQRSAETEARQQREQLAHLDRIDMLGEMASGIAHEINQPLTAISLFAQAGKRLFGAGKKDQLPDIFEKLSQHAHRASAVIERMQSMARRQESIKEIVDCNTLIEEVAKLAESEARIRDMTIIVETQSGLPAVAVDAVQIQQVALNLIRNGMEAMQVANRRDGNTIRLQTRRVNDDFVEVAVTDVGCGVSAEVAEILFTPFSTTKKSGMGMGLSISRAIIAAHGGQLNFCNNDSAGATFFFTLPAADHEGSE